MPSFTCALLLAPSSSSVGTSSLVPQVFGGDHLAPFSESAYERRKSIANGVAQPYRLARSPPSFDGLTSSPASSSRWTASTSTAQSASFSLASQPEGRASNEAPSSSGSSRRGLRAKAGGSMGGFPSLDNLRPPSPFAALASQTRPTPHRPQAGYADSLARVLRDGGIPVSNLRTLSQVQSHMALSPPLPPTPTSPPSSDANGSLFQPSFSLSPPPTSSPLARSFSSASSQSAQASQAFILLLPLNDLAPSTLATARLIRESGKTPSSICFDLEHEVGEKEWERTFEEALAVIEQVESMRTSWGREVLVVAYSADPDISPEAVQRCRNAGADAVLYPPFEESSITIQHLQQALSSHRSQFQSFSFSGSQSSTRPPLRSRVSPPHPLSQLNSPPDTPPTVPASASQPSSANTQTSYQFGSAGSSSQSPRTPRFDPFPNAEAPTPTTSVFSTLSTGDTNGPRRASVDTGGLALALERADRASSGSCESDDDDGAEGEGSEVDTLFAEVLSEMHCQTRSAVESHLTSPHLGTPLTDTRRAELIRLMGGWHFEPHRLSTQDLHHCSCILFEATLMMEGLWELDIPLSRMHRFLFSLQNIYHAPNPYHNAVHALDVTQATYSFLAATGVVPSFEYLIQTPARRPSSPWKRSPAVSVGVRDERAKEVLRPQDVFALMVAAVGHDVAHPGLSNIFMKNAKSPISQVYSDSSALENMHCCIVVTLLRKHGFDFLFPSTASVPLPETELTPRARRAPSLPPTPPLSDASDAPPPFPPSMLDWTDFRAILSAAILSTDMAMHFGWITKLVEMGQRLALEAEGETLPAGSSRSEDELVRSDRVMLCQAILKCADISNPTRPYEVSKHWSTVLLDEWTNQACLETGLDLPVSVIKNADAALQAKGQVGFINLFVYPLFSASAAVLPGLAPYMQYCTENLATWSERLQTLSSSTPSSPTTPKHLPMAPIPPSPTPSDSTAVPFGSDSPYRTLFPLTLPSTLLSGDGGESESASTTTCGDADQHRRRAMQAGKSAAIGLPQRERWKREKRWRRRSADGVPRVSSP